MSSEKILITGAGTGFGKMFALELAKMGKDVIATTEVFSQVSALEKEVKEQGLTMQIDKLDVTDPKDRQKAWNWDIDVLVNNAAIKEGGALVDIPEDNLRNQFDVNVIGPVLLTQGFARKMIEKNKGRIVFVSSISGMMVNPFSGPYSASKYATEALVNTLSQELQEFNIEVATINPGPYLTGFNDREMETWRSWQDDASKRVFNYEDIAFPFEQFNPEELIKGGLKVILGETKSYRNVIPEKMISQVKEQQEYLWNKQTDEALGERHQMVQKAYDLEPETKAEDY
ncbi:SDR family oxidoreductase [Marinilactibacillus sp. XAAS-LB27]|uniref:SDR family oxidoreductase n=1 Tax=Marinilactibacillus sp. XAAS-LB27 TaxID=3114538 RepID=UPI002E19DEB8|nr:SDR family oxidoreductase [Marinilactibacillus sp. XAAS-LB27]